MTFRYFQNYGRGGERMREVDEINRSFPNNSRLVMREEIRYIQGSVKIEGVGILYPEKHGPTNVPFMDEDGVVHMASGQTIRALSNDGTGREVIITYEA